MIARTLLTTGTFILCCSLPLQAKVIGTFGITYLIAEGDALAEIEARARQVDWQKVLDKKKVRNYQGPPDKKSLPRAKLDRTFQVDMTYTSEIDVPDGKGGILYSKGYTFNPLDYVSYPKTLVVINGNDPEQLKWLMASEYQQRIDVTLLLSEGMYGAVAKRVNRPVFYADRKIIERFRLKAVPSIIRQQGKMMAVTEVALPTGKTKKEMKSSPRNKRIP